MHGGRRTRAGRKKGVQNKVNARVREQALASGESPLAYMLRIMRYQKQDTSVRNDMAKSAAPFLHPRLQAVEHSSGTDDDPSDRCIRVTFVSADGTEEVMNK